MKFTQSLPMANSTATIARQLMLDDKCGTTTRKRQSWLLLLGGSGNIGIKIIKITAW